MRLFEQMKIILKNKDLSIAKKGQLAGALIGIAVALIIGTIGLKIVNDVISNSSFTGLTSTVTTYITVGLAVSLLVIAFGVVGGRK